MKLTKSAPGNVTIEMGFALMDLADTARKHPDLCAHLKNAKIDSRWDDLNVSDSRGEIFDSAKENVIRLLQINGLEFEKLISSNNGVLILGRKEK